MRNDLNKIVNSKFSDIEKSGELTLLLLSLYSQLFLNGAQPSTCGKCMRDYHIKIINKGLQIIEFMENKTNILKDGLHYVRVESKHFSNDNLSDEKAIYLLEKGLIKESNFLTLPKGYKEEKKPYVPNHNKKKKHR